MPYADKLNGQIILIVLTGKTNRTVVAVPNQYRKTEQQQQKSFMVIGNTLEKILHLIRNHILGSTSTRP